jgi:enoyl-CoA hydratase
MAEGAGIETVWIDNPPVNALSEDALAGLQSAFERLGPDTHVAVLRGRGERGFSAGADVTAIAAGLATRRIQQLADVIEDVPVPVIAAIHGHCLGGGLELALACDLRVARSDAELALPEVRLGLVPGGGGTQRLPRLIGPGRAGWLLMSGERVGAAQAEAWGLVERVVDDLDEGVERVAGTLATRSPEALRALKQLLRATRDERSDEHEYEAFSRSVASADGREGVAAFLEKRAPRWGGTGP